jgi:two-component system, chemotaxis family, sensor kinase CheA
MGEYDDLIQDFLIECGEHIETLESDLAELERNPRNQVVLGCVFRSIHTVKGNCGFLGFQRLQDLTHAAENLLSSLRKGDFELTKNMTIALLQTVDMTRDILKSLEVKGTEGDSDPRPLIETFRKLQKQNDISSGTTKFRRLDLEAIQAASIAAEAAKAELDDSNAEATEPKGAPRPSKHPAKKKTAKKEANSYPRAPLMESRSLLEDSNEAPAPQFPLPQPWTEKLLAPEKDFPFSPFPSPSGQQARDIGEETDHLNSSEIIAKLNSLDLEAQKAATESGEKPILDSRETKVLGPPSQMLQAIAQSEDEPPKIPAQPSGQLITSGIYNFADLIASLRIDKKEGKQSQSLLESEERPAVQLAPALPKFVDPVLEETPTPGALTENSVRIDLALLDQMMNLIGELVLCRNQLTQVASIHPIPELSSACQRLNLITGQLQERVMKTRMQTVDKLFKGFKRLVRVVSRQCNKVVLIELAGSETELDRTLVEAIKDPLHHVIRNAIDHGIENPEQRIKKGKPREGYLKIRAYHESGQVHVQVKDDGAGINPNRIRRRLIERNLLSAEDTERLDDSQIVSLIFMPGFSTADEVTQISGRGVGMDVVKASIEALGGTIQVQTMLGSWTAFTISVPLTLAILPALIISSRGQRFAIPQANVVELMKIGSSQNIKTEVIDGSTVFRLRDQLLPLIDLGMVLQGKAILNAENPNASLIVLKANEQTFGLIIDKVHDSQEIVVKALDALLKSIQVYAAATILDDGKVALILDVPGLANIAGIRSRLQNTNVTKAESSLTGDIVPMLIFGVGAHWRMAVPLEVVWRLEEIPRNSIERLNKQLIIQHHGQLIPITFLNEFFGLEADKSADMDQEILQLILCCWRNRYVGLIVDRVIDIAEEEFQEQRHERKKGVYASAVLNGEATDLLDVREIIQITNTMLLDNPEEANH